MNFFKKSFWENLPASVKWIYILFLIRIFFYFLFYVVVFVLITQGVSDNWTNILPYMVFKKANIAKAFGPSGIQYSIGFIGVAFLFRVIFSIGQIALFKYRKKVWYWIFLSFAVIQTIARFNIPIILITIIILSILESARRYLRGKSLHENERVIDVFLESDIELN